MTPETGGFAGKGAVVTGGSRGIGRAVVLDLARAGAHVLFVYAQDEKAADETVRQAGGSVVALRSDISRPGAASGIVEHARGVLPSLDFLVNNAGIVRPAPVAFMSDENWTDVIDTNLNGAFFMSRVFVQTLLKQRHPGAVVNVSSLYGLRPPRGAATTPPARPGSSR